MALLARSSSQKPPEAKSKANDKSGENIYHLALQMGQGHTALGGCVGTHVITGGV